jgi:adenylate cyclase
MSERFEDLLLGFSRESNAHTRGDIERQLWSEFGRELAVLVMDMSGFSSLTQRFGVVHYLSMVKRMQLTAKPIVTTHDGEVVKFEADNCFCVFPTAVSAIRAAIALNLAFDAANIVTPPELDVRVSCGIDYGAVLLVGNRDFYGNPVNRASKLGEDVAGPGEILVTGAAMETVSAEEAIDSRPMRLAIAGIEIDACLIHYRRGGAGPTIPAM